MAVPKSILPDFVKAGSGLALIGLSAYNSYESGQMAEASFLSAGQQALEGGQYSASVYRNAGAIAQQNTQLNKAISALNYNRQQDTMSRQMNAMFSANRVTQAGSGFSLSSGSYLAVANRAITDVTRQVLQLRNNESLKQAQLSYEGNLSQMTAENQARSAEYQGQVAQVNYQNKANAAEYAGKVAAGNSLLDGLTKVTSLVSNYKDASKLGL